MSSKGKGLKNIALAAVRDTLRKSGFPDPDNLQLRPGRKRAEGTGYVASGIVDGKMTRLARLRYNPDTGRAVLEEDYRAQCSGATIHAPHANPLHVRRVGKIVKGVELRIPKYFAGTAPNLKAWPTGSFAQIVVRDLSGRQHTVYCVAAENNQQAKVLRRKLTPAQQLQTCVVIWPQGQKGADVSEKIAESIKVKLKAWPKPK